jgi:PAS domain S-box-containing protein
MSIGAKLTVSAAITIGLALVVALTVIVSSRDVDRAVRNDHFTDSVIKGVLNLNSLSYEYLLLRDKRPAAQWRLQHASLGRILAEHAVGSNEEQALLERLRSSHEQLKKLFETVSERAAEDRGGPSSYDELDEGVTAQLMARAEILANDASLLGRESARYMGAVQRSSLIFILGSAFLLIASAAATAALLKKGIGGSIRALELGTERIAAGDLDYRLDMRTGDELGDLARSFDTMTERLLTVTVSKDRLQQEVRQRELTENALRESEQRWATTLSSIGDAVIATDSAGIVTFMNPVAESLTGWTLREASMKPVTEIFNIVNEQTRAAVESPVVKVLREGAVVGLANHTILIMKDGTEIPIDDSGAPIRDGGGTTMGVVLVFRDISERKQAEERTVRLASYPQLNPNPVMEVDASGEITFSNPGSQAILTNLGLDEKDLPSLLPQDLVVVLRDWDKITEAVLDREVVVGDRVLGETIHLVPQFKAARIYAQDVTDRRQAELERELSVQFLRSVNESNTKTDLIKGAVTFFRERSGFEAVGVRLREGDDYPYYETHGFPEEFVLLESSLCLRDKGGCRVLDDSGSPIMACMCGNVIQGRFDPSQPFFTERGSFWTNCTTELLSTTTEEDRQASTRNRCNGEGYESVALIALRVGNECLGLLQLNDRRPGRFTPERIALYERLAGYLAVALAKVEAEEKLQGAHDELEQRVIERTDALRRQAELLELAYNAILVQDMDRRITFWNTRAEELYGWTKKEALGKVAHTFLKTKFPVPFNEYMEKLTQEGRWEGELIHSTKDGRRITVASRQALQRDAAGNPFAVMEIDLDVTESHHLEAQLRQAQKMEALGTLSGGIAHDFNNILAAIIGFTELAAGHAAKGSRDERYLTRVTEAALRGREVVKQLLAFSRQTEQEKKPLQLSSVVKETAKLLRATTPSTISVRVIVLSESGLILGDPTQIYQVLMNLCTNAVHAMQEKGGALDIELADFSVPASASDGMKPGLYMSLTVRDTGAGIPPDIVDRIFDPFFTTKKVGEGTGLGLSVVHGIVKQSGGYIAVESAPGEGSTFTVYFPKTAGEPSAEVVSDDYLPTGYERVLFVDDEEALVEMGEEILAELGYHVTSRTGSKEALALLREDPSRFDLVITDQTMPDMTGVELAKEILALRPDMPIIMCTGFSHAVDADKARAAGIRAFVMKPLTKKEIARTVRKVLDE